MPHHVLELRSSGLRRVSYLPSRFGFFGLEEGNSGFKNLVVFSVWVHSRSPEATRAVPTVLAAAAKTTSINAKTRTFRAGCQTGSI